jgi:RimJ/RimL family protein N-acetyltransferase
MRHNLHAEGFGVRLRPVTIEDAGFIVWLRNLDHAKGRVGDSAVTESAQRVWLENYFGRPGDYYFIIETAAGRPVGAYGIYDQAGDSAESGRWVIRTEVPAAIPSAIHAFDLAFDSLKLRELRTKTVSTNQRVLSLNVKFGFRQTRVETNSQVIGGKLVDQIHYVLDSAAWPGLRPRLVPLARVAEKQIVEWDASISSTQF